MLADAGLSFVLDPTLVRGLDYYTRTAFEVQTERLGAQNAVAGEEDTMVWSNSSGAPTIPVLDLR